VIVIDCVSFLRQSSIRFASNSVDLLNRIRTFSEMPMNAALAVSSPALDASPLERVRECALQLFVSQGFGAVSLRDLAAAVQMRVGSLYHHIEGKQALLFELISEYEENLAYALSAGERDASPDPATFIARYLRHVLDNPRGATLAALEMRSLNGEQLAYVRRVRRDGLALLQRALRGVTGADEGRCWTLARGVVALLDGLVQAAREEPASCHEELQRTASAMALGMIRAAG